MNKILKEIIEIAQQWQSEKLTCYDIKIWAEQNETRILNSLEDTIGEEQELIVTALRYLQDIDMNLTIRDDTMEFINFLNHSEANYKQSLVKWDKYLDKIDYKERKKLLKSDDFYSQFCN